VSDDNMERYYAANTAHYDTGLMRIGCTEKQALAYAAYFRKFRSVYYQKIEQASQLLDRSSEGPIRILDVGCGLGEDIHALDQMLSQAEFVGVEISSTAVEICERSKSDNMKFFCGELSNLPEPPQSFDLIINFCVLEHVSSPIDILQHCEHFLKKQGVIISVVPNHLYSWSWHLPQYLVMKLLGKDVLTHSVRTRIMQMAFQQLDLHVLHYDVFGFRPPQPFFCQIPERLLAGTLKNMEAIGEALSHTFFRPYLYLELFVCSKRSMSDMKTLRREVFVDSNDISAAWGLLAVPYFVYWWIMTILSAAKRAFRGISKGHG